MSELKKQIYLLTALRSIRMFMISIPVIAVYWNSFGMTMRDIMILQVIFSLAWVMLEMPSGWLADKFGNKQTIVWGAIIGAFGHWLYWQIPSYTGFVFAELALALSVSLVSGSREALLYDTLEAHGVTKNYTAYQGKLISIGQVSEALSALSAVAVVSYFDITAVLAAQFFVLTLAIPVALLLQPYRSHDRQTDSLWSIIHYCFHGNQRLLWLNLFTGTVSASTLTMVWYSQLHWKSIGVPVEYYGFIWAGLMLVVATGARAAAHIEESVRFRILFSAIAIAPMVLFGLMATFAETFFSLTIVWLFSLLRGVSMPIVSNYIQRECTERNRATVLSANALVGRLVFSATSPFMGWVADIWSFGTAFLVSAAVFGVITIYAFVNWLMVVQTKAT